MSLYTTPPLVREPGDKPCAHSHPRYVTTEAETLLTNDRCERITNTYRCTYCHAVLDTTQRIRRKDHT